MPETRGPAIITGNFVPFFIALPFLVARFWSRAIILGKLYADDYVLFAGWIGSVGILANSVVQVHYGAGRHQQDIPFETISSFFKAGYADRQFYAFSTGMIRSSLCIMLLRIFGTSMTSRVMLWFINILTLVSTFALMAFNLFNCHPISSKWDLTVKGTCVNDEPGFWASIAISLITNVFLLVFSALKINDLQMHRRQKMIMTATIGIGWLIVVAIIVRAIRIAAVLHNANDATWRTFDVAIWSAVEINVSVFCVSAMAIKPFVKQVAPRIMSWLSSNTGKTYGGSGKKTTVRKSERVETRLEQGIMQTEKDKDGGIMKMTAVTVQEER
ncbi:Hypothetical protein D9617_15g042120 [Elsinoe fawcettii]|nr:Hypothetical protein D9617_15g042120 [Elsinoe fawcettii]